MDLTTPQKELLYYIIKHTSSDGFQPSIYEIAEATGKGPAAVSSMLALIERKGYIRRSGHRRIEFIKKF
jgi:SOS-response transcriptional repressor LexA